MATENAEAIDEAHIRALIEKRVRAVGEKDTDALWSKLDLKPYYSRSCREHQMSA